MEDPALGDGWAHWVSMKPYHAYVRKYGYQVEVSGYLFFRSIFLPLVILYSPTFVTQNLKPSIMDIQSSVRDTGQQALVGAFVGAILLFGRMA
jgi:hypothetical protein